MHFLKVKIFKVLSRNRHLLIVLLTISPVFYLYMIDHNQTRLTDTIYSLTSRMFVMIFYFTVMMNAGEDTRRFFSHEDKKVAIGDKPNIPINQVKMKILHIVSTILRSSYCTHVPILIMTINSWRYPILTSSQLVIITTIWIWSNKWTDSLTLFHNRLAK